MCIDKNAHMTHTHTIASFLTHTLTHSSLTHTLTHSLTHSITNSLDVIAGYSNNSVEVSEDIGGAVLCFQTFGITIGPSVEIPFAAVLESGSYSASSMCVLLHAQSVHVRVCVHVCVRVHAYE